MGNLKIKRLALILSFLLLPLLLSAQAQDTTSTSSAKKAAAKSASKSKAAAKTAAKKPATRTASPHHVVAARATTGVVKKLARTTTAAVRRPRVPWKDVVDRASKGNSVEGDDLTGEDPAVRNAAVDALGSLNGSVLVSDPKSGRILSIVNQKLAFSSGE